MGVVNLVIKYNKGIISIPFKDIISLDEFTVGYDNPLELLNALNRLLNLDIKNGQLIEIYVDYLYNNKRKRLPVKYSVDNYDIEDLKIMYAKYYKDNHVRILAYNEGIRYVKHDKIINYNLRCDDITDRDIDLAVIAYFEKAGYKKYRDAYFRLKEAGYKVRINKLVSEVDRTNLAKYQTDDEYLSYLMRYASIGDREHDKVIEELSYYDSDDIRMDMNNGEYGLFDGINHSTKEDDTSELDELITLEAMAGKSVEELIEIVNNYRDGYYNRGHGRR